VRIDPPQLVVSGIAEVATRPLAVRDQRADRLVRLAERHTVADEELGDIGREGEAGGRAGGEHRLVDPHRRDHAAHRGQHHQERVERVEDRLLVLLQVAVVRQGQPLQHREHAGEMTDEPAGLAARELGDVGVASSAA